MSNTITVAIEDIDEQMLTYDRLRLYRSNTPQSVTNQALLIEEVTLVADQQLYTIVDTSGEPGHWYGYTLFNDPSGPESGISTPWRVGALTLRVARLEAAREAKAGFESVTTAAGTATTLPDAVLLDDGVDASYQEGVWLYRPDALLEADKLRRVKEMGFDTAIGAWTVSRSWQNAPTLGEVYQVFRLMPPIDTPGQAYSWDRALRKAITVGPLRYVDELFLAKGDGINPNFTVDAYPFINDSNLRHVWLRTTDAQGVVTSKDALEYGQNWNLLPNGPGVWRLEFRKPPASTEEIWLAVVRAPDIPYRDDDVIGGVSLEVITLATAMHAFRGMGEAYTREAEEKAREFMLAYKGPEPVVIGLW